MKEKRATGMRTRRSGRWLPRQPRLGARMCQGTFFLRKWGLVFLAKEQIPVQAADNDDTAEDIADGGRDQIVEDKGSDI